MTYTEVAPPQDLAAIVDRFWSRSSRGSGRATRVLPDGCVDVIVDVARGTAALVGAMTRAIEVPDAPGRLVAVRFKPGMAAAVTRCGLDELTDDEVELGALGEAALGPRVAEAGLAALAGWVRQRRGAAPARPGWIARAVARLSAGARVEHVAAELDVTRQHLARGFRREVGLSPKQLMRIARMQRAVAAIGAGHRDPARLAAELGFVDQAHLCNDVHALTGATPRVIAAERPLAMVHLFGSISPSPPAHRAVALRP